MVDRREQQNTGLFQIRSERSLCKTISRQPFSNSEKAHNFSKLRRHLSGILAPRAQVRYHQVDASISIDRFRAKGELLKQQS